MSLATVAARTQNQLSYRKLDHAKNEIRLAKFTKRSEVVQAVGGICDLVCTVNIYSLTDYNDEYVEYESQAPASWSESEKIEEWMSSRKDEYPVRYRWGDYLAMSHTWGDESQTASVMVNGKVLTISRNLAQGLRALSRYPAIIQGHLMFFNDFLCLDQNDKLEIQHELERMSTIFSSALGVIAWVGPSQDGNDAVMTALQDLERTKCYNTASSASSLLEAINEDVWLPLLRFFQRPLWTRVWLVQELTLASQRTILLCGDQHARIQTLWILASIIHSAASKAHLLLTKIAGHWTDRHDERLQFFSTKVRFCMLPQIAASVQGGASCDILMLMDVCRRSLQFDARDKVYGGLGVLPAAVARLIEPYVTKEAHKVYADLVRAIVKVTRRLDILQNCRLDWNHPVLPTWTPDLMQPHLSHVLGNDQIMDAGIDVDNEPRLSSDGQLLICRGFVLDTIDHLTPPQSPLAPVSREERAQSTSERVLAKPEAVVRESLWKTLVGGSVDSYCQAAPESYSVLCIPWERSPSRDVEATAQALVDDHVCPSDSVRDLVIFLHFRQRVPPEFDLCGHSLQAFFPSTFLHTCEVRPAHREEYHQEMTSLILRQFARTMKRRRLIVTSNGRIGASVRQARKGDTIAVPRGCNVPMILRRPPTDSGTLPSNGFMVVGDCYVHGLMNGEAFDQGIEERDIVLC